MSPLQKISVSVVGAALALGVAATPALAGSVGGLAAGTDPDGSATDVVQVSPGNVGTVVTVHPTGVAGVLSASGCHGTTCIYVNGKGLRVNYATVTNDKGNPVGRGMISSNWDGRTHDGPVLRKHESWRFDYNRIMNNGNKVCGSIEGRDVACVTIHK